MARGTRLAVRGASTTPPFHQSCIPRAKVGLKHSSTISPCLGHSLLQHRLQGTGATTRCLLKGCLSRLGYISIPRSTVSVFCMPKWSLQEESGKFVTGRIIVRLLGPEITVLHHS